MIETKNLILDKAKFSDWKEMYENVWSRPESARYMAWQVTTTQEDAKLRIMRTIEFQNNHDVYTVYEKWQSDWIRRSRKDKTFCVPGDRNLFGTGLCGKRIWNPDFGSVDSILQTRI